MKTLISRSQNIAPTIYWLLALCFLLYFEKKGLGNDFPSFYYAGKKVQTLSNPWDVNIGNQFSAYLNGPLSSLFFGLVSFLPYSLALSGVRLITLLVIPSLIAAMATLTQVQLIKENQYLLSSLILFTFPIRANLEYGQFVVIFSAIFIITLKNCASNPAYQNYFLLGLISVLLLDYKPQVFLPVLLLVFLKKMPYVLGFVSGILLSLISSWLLSRTLLTSWLRAISTRSGQVSHGDDQMSLYSFFTSNRTLTYSILLILVFPLLLRLFTENKDNTKNMGFNQLFAFFTIWSAITPFSHPTDMFISILVGCLFFSTLSETRHRLLSTFILSMAMVWSNNIIISLVIVFVATSLVAILQRSPFVKIPKLLLVMLLPLIALPLSLELNATIEANMRQTLNFLSIAAIALISMKNLRIEKLARP